MIMFKTLKEGCSCSSKRLLDVFCKSSSLLCPNSGSGWINVEGVGKRNKSVFQDRGGGEEGGRAGLVKGL